MRRLFFTLALIATFAFNAASQILEPIKWDTSVEMKSDNEGQLIFKASVDQGWHLYGLQLPEGGPRPTAIVLKETPGVSYGELKPSKEPIKKVDMIFNLELTWWDSDVTFTVPFTLTSSGAKTLEGTISFQGCNDETCIAPKKEPFEVKVGKGDAAPQEEIATVEDVIADEVAPASKTTEADLWAPVVFPEEEVNESITESPWWYIFLMGFVGGLVALLTPCVWPMIPMTVSFFLKKSKERSKSIRDAMIYGGSIVVIYLVLGLAITMIFGASKLNDLATNAVFNLAFFVLLVVFAISFFGAFNITLPSSWSNRMDSKAESTSGMLSIFFMAFTLALVSFSCTGPIIGTLLVEAASNGNIAGPAIGMLGFAIALALPFSLFAVFPSWLQGMPSSGGWLNSVKVVLGFLELALSLKFLSVADLAYGWGILDREVFVCLWIVIFTLLGLYLLGKIAFSHDTPIQKIGVGRFFLALISLSFAMYLVPGLWGAPLKSVSAFVPPLFTQDFNLYDGGQFEEFDDYDAGMAYAAKNERPVLIDFSGYGCVNCRKMEGAVFDTPEVEKIIKENFVLIKLMVDDKKPLEKEVTVEENGKKIILETVGDKWSYLQRSKFGANSQPYYIILDNGGRVLSTPTYYDENLPKFVEWLNKGIEAYANNK